MFRYSNVVATIALFVVLGGSSYAAGTQLAKNSVGTKQVRDRSLIARDFKHGQLKAGPQGPAGPNGAQGSSGVVKTPATRFRPARRTCSVRDSRATTRWRSARAGARAR